MVTTFKQYISSTNSQSVSFNGTILILGYGTVGQAILPLILKHINTRKIIVLEKDDHTTTFLSRHKDTNVTYLPNTEITISNYKKILSKYVQTDGMIVNCSLNIQADALLKWCMDNEVMQIDTSLERWKHESDETIPILAERTLYHTHKELRKAIGNSKGKTTCVVTHGANPGYVTHLTKRALLQLSMRQGKKIKAPLTQEGWAQLMKSLGIKTIHIAERDTQIVDEPKVKNEFVNTWSCEGFWAEGRAPAEMGWGTHEDKNPEGGESQGNDSAVYLFQPGVAVLMKSWVPDGGQYNGFCIQHSESITISEYFSTKDKSFRPSVYYVYQPCDSAITSVHEMRGRELDLQYKQRIVKDEIISGIDELGVLLIGNDFVFWHGSQMSIDLARTLIMGENATSVQIAGSMIGAIIWMIKNPREGYREPESLPFEEILAVGDQYWAPLKSVMSNWSPSQDKNSLFYKKYDFKNPCKFENFRVWT